jgi:hypothetical protein
MGEKSSCGPEIHLNERGGANRRGFTGRDTGLSFLSKTPLRRELFLLLPLAGLLLTQIACGGSGGQMSSSGTPGGTMHQYATGQGPTWVAAADFNGDKNLDLAVSNGTDNTVSVLLGNGDGTFRGHVDYPADTSLWAVAAGDFNGDGKQDLVVASSFDGLLLGNGDGTFQAMLPLSTRVLDNYSLTVGDLNGDGKPDLVFVGSADGDQVLLGNGDGTFLAGEDVSYWTDFYPCCVVLGDFNGDSKVDVVLSATNHGSGWAIAIPGNGDGSFQFMGFGYYEIGYAEAGSGVVLSDFNGDGKPDIATGSGFNSSVGLLLGNGDGTFQSPTEFATGSGTPTAVAVADFNADGKPDLVVVNGNSLGVNGSNTVSVLLGNGDGTFQPHVDYPTGQAPTSVAIGDFNGDGKLDLAITNQDDNTVSILLGNGDGTFKSKW